MEFRKEHLSIIKGLKEAISIGRLHIFFIFVDITPPRIAFDVSGKTSRRTLSMLDTEIVPREKAPNLYDCFTEYAERDKGTKPPRSFSITLSPHMDKPTLQRKGFRFKDVKVVFNKRKEEFDISISVDELRNLFAESMHNYRYGDDAFLDTVDIYAVKGDGKYNIEPAPFFMDAWDSDVREGHIKQNIEFDLPPDSRLILYRFGPKGLVSHEGDTMLWQELFTKGVRDIFYSFIVPTRMDLKFM